jgi:integrase
MSLADVITAVMAHADLSKSRRRDLCSALCSVARALHSEPHLLDASPWELRRRLERLRVADVGMTAESWRTVHSNLDSALQLAGLGMLPRRSIIALTPQWDALLSLLNDRYDRSKLSRLARYCDERGIGPGELDSDVFSEFGRVLVHGSLVSRPEQVHREAALTWNKCAGAIPGWPALVLPVPRYRKNLSLTVGGLPASFGVDLEAYLRMRALGDLLADESVRPASPTTVRNERAHLLQVATLLVKDGVPVGSLTKLSCLVVPAMAKRAVNVSFIRHGKEANGQTDGLARTLILVAQRWAPVPETDLRALKSLAKKVRPRREMTEKNKHRLRMLADPANAARLLRLPRDLMAAAIAGPVCQASAILAQNALAIAILLVAPMRVKNLAALNLETHITRTRAGMDGEVFLVIPAREVKNEKDLDFPLPPAVVALLDSYLKHFRPVLMQAPSPWLFPNTRGGPKAAAQLSAQIPEAIYGATGLDVHCHLFRHFAALLYLKQHPGDYETVRQLLGHKSVETTIAYYCWFERSDAFRRYDAMLDGLRRDYDRREL